jgi:hypothetical protein
MVTITPIDSSGVFRMPVKTILRGLAFFKGDAYKVLVETISGRFPSFRLEAGMTMFRGCCGSLSDPCA